MRKIDINKIKFQDGKWQFDEMLKQQADWDEITSDLVFTETAKTFKDSVERNEFWKQYSEWKRK